MPFKAAEQSSKMEAVPHGGVLINRELTGKLRDEAKEHAQKLPVLKLSERELCDLEMIATGAMSPLEGFMTRKDYDSCLEKNVFQTDWSGPFRSRNPLPLKKNRKSKKQKKPLWLIREDIYSRFWKWKIFFRMTRKNKRSRFTAWPKKRIRALGKF